MNEKTYIAVGIDVSKGKSTVAAKQGGGAVVLQPFEITHDQDGLNNLVNTVSQLNGEIRIIMEHTSNYWRPVAASLQKAGFFVSVINALLIHDYTDNSLRRVKTDKADSLKIASYGLAYWEDLKPQTPDDDNREVLRNLSRLYERLTVTSGVMRNGLIASLDQSFPGANTLFPTPNPNKEGHLKWVDFVRRFYHAQTVCGTSKSVFDKTYRKWCERTGYHFYENDVDRIYSYAKQCVPVLEKSKGTKHLIVQAADGVNAVLETMQSVREELYQIASELPEFPVVMDMYGVGPIMAPLLMAEIGDVRRFRNKNALVAFAGLDAPPYQSGTFEAKSRRISKRGSPHLRRALFMIMKVINQKANPKSDIYCFMIKKRSEGKHFYVYMTAGCAKFLRIYYARVTEYLSQLEAA